MSFFKKAKHAAIARRFSDERLYERVLKEIEAGDRRDGLWAKALEKSKGNDGEAQALYIQYCVQALRDEEEILALQDEAKRKAIASGTSAGRQIKQSSGNPIDAYDANGYTPLMRAVRSHDLKAVRDLLERGADPHVVDRDWGTSTALDFAKRELGKMNAPDARRTLVEIVAHIE